MFVSYFEHLNKQFSFLSPCRLSQKTKIIILFCIKYTCFSKIFCTFAAE